MLTRLKKLFKYRHLKVVPKVINVKIEVPNKREDPVFRGDDSGIGYVVGGSELQWFDAKTGLYHNHILSHPCTIECNSYTKLTITPQEIAEIKPVIELKGEKLVIAYLEYVLSKINDKNVFEKTDKMTAEDINISEDKAQRVKKLCIDRGYLIKDFRRRRDLHVDVSKIQEHIKVTSV